MLAVDVQVVGCVPPGMAYGKFFRACLGSVLGLVKGHGGYAPPPTFEGEGGDGDVEGEELGEGGESEREEGGEGEGKRERVREIER